jgi:hypothetical protein
MKLKWNSVEFLGNGSQCETLAYDKNMDLINTFNLIGSISLFGEYSTESRQQMLTVHGEVERGVSCFECL